MRRSAISSDRRHDAPRGEAGDHADEERAETHQRHGDEEGVFAADHVAEPAEDQRAEWADGEAGGERKQREDEADIRRHVGEKVFRQERAERAVDVKVVPFEDGAQRGGKDHETLFARHPSCARCVDSHGSHWRSPQLVVGRVRRLILSCSSQPPNWRQASLQGGPCLSARGRKPKVVGALRERAVSA